MNGTGQKRGSGRWYWGFTQPKSTPTTQSFLSCPFHFWWTSCGPWQGLWLVQQLDALLGPSSNTSFITLPDRAMLIYTFTIKCEKSADSSSRLLILWSGIKWILDMNFQECDRPIEKKPLEFLSSFYILFFYLWVGLDMLSPQQGGDLVSSARKDKKAMLTTHHSLSQNLLLEFQVHPCPGLALSPLHCTQSLFFLSLLKIWLPQIDPPLCPCYLLI